MKLAIMVLASAVALSGKTVATSLEAGALSSQPSEVAVGDSATARLQVDEAWIAIKGLRFHDAATCHDDPGKPEVPGPVALELVEGLAIGMPARITLPDARQCGLELSLRRATAKREGVPPALRGLSILVKARRDDGVRVVIRSRLRGRVWLAADAEEGFAVRDGGRLILAADLARWLGGLDLDTAAGAEPGALIEIDDRTNRELLEAFEAAVASGLGLYLPSEEAHLTPGIGARVASGAGR